MTDGEIRTRFARLETRLERCEAHLERCEASLDAMHIRLVQGRQGVEDRLAKGHRTLGRRLGEVRQEFRPHRDDADVRRAGVRISGPTSTASRRASHASRTRGWCTWRCGSSWP